MNGKRPQTVAVSLLFAGTYRGQICAGQYNSSTKAWVNNQCSSAHHNDPGCYCVPTVLKALKALGASVVYAPGVNVTDLAAKNANDTRLIAEAVAVAKAADRVVLVLGNGNVSTPHAHTSTCAHPCIVLALAARTLCVHRACDCSIAIAPANL